MKALVAALCLWGGTAAACTVAPQSVTAYPGSVVTDAATSGPVRSAWFETPVTRYRHFVLGRQHEPSVLAIDAMGNVGLCGHRLELDAAHVFEDVAPRLADLDGDGTNEVIVVRSHRDRGAQLAVYRWTGRDLVLAAATPYIGQSDRWLAPAGAADLDGDGAVELAYVDRPHLARVLRIWRYRDGALVEVAQVEGVTNHRIGEGHITGGIRDCGSGPEIVVASADWTALVAVTLGPQGASARRIGPYTGPDSAAAAMACSG